MPGLALVGARGKFILTVFLGMAEFERQLIRERTRVSLRSAGAS
jgi:DNA invertase Pin-like site-specific DNA recombinase